MRRLNGKLRVPYTRLDGLTVLLALTAVACLAAWEFSESRDAAGIVLIVLGIAFVALDGLARRYLPAFHEQRGGELGVAAAIFFIVAGAAWAVFRADAVLAAAGVLAFALAAATSMEARRRRDPQPSGFGRTQRSVVTVGMVAAFVVSFTALDLADFDGSDQRKREKRERRGRDLAVEAVAPHSPERGEGGHHRSERAAAGHQQVRVVPPGG